MINKTLTTALLLFYSFSGLAQPTIQFGKQYNTKIPLYNFSSEIIRSAASPDNPSKILLSVYGWNALKRRAEINTFSSCNGGQTYTLTLQDTSSQWVSEASNAFGLNDNAYVITCASKRSGNLRGHPYGEMHLFHSSDGGMTWNQTAKGSFLDWTAATVDVSKGKFQNRLYVVAYDIANDSGGWMGPRKPLLHSLDNGKTISKPLFTGKFPEDGGGYPLAAKVNDNGQLLVLYKRDHPGGLVIAVSNDGGNSLELMPTMGKAPSVSAQNIFYTGFDVDKSSTKFNGRVYVAYAVIYNGRPTILLAYSNNMGYSWKHLKAVDYISDKKEQELGEVKMAVNKNGTIGIMWNEPEQNIIRFTISKTGGETFEKPITISSVPNIKFENSQFFETQLQTMGTFEPDDSATNLQRSNLGLSVRILPTSTVMDLSCDSDGNFHVFWSETNPNGYQVLLTNKLQDGERVTSDKHTIVNTKDFQNINDKVIIDVGNQQYNATTGEIMLDFTLTNKSDSVIHAPVFIELSKIVAGYGFDNPKLLNNDLRYSESGNPVLDLTNYIPDSTLYSGKETSRYTIVFKVDQIQPTSVIWQKVQTGETIHTISCQFNSYIK